MRSVPTKRVKASVRVAYALTAELRANRAQPLTSLGVTNRTRKIFVVVGYVTAEAKITPADLLAIHAHVGLKSTFKFDFSRS